MDAIVDSEWVTVLEAAKIAGKSRGSIYQAIRKGRLPSKGKDPVLVRVEDVRKLRAYEMSMARSLEKVEQRLRDLDVGNRRAMLRELVAAYLDSGYWPILGEKKNVLAS